MPTLSTFFIVYKRNADYLQSESARAFIHRDLVSNLIIAENALRELTQHEERLQYETTALKKLTPAEALAESLAQLEEAEQQLRYDFLQYTRQVYSLWKATSSLPFPFKRSYDDLRRNPRWFIREEMVQDCVDQGGCCGRPCKCCARRHLSKRPKGQGHCSPECRCCIEFWGFEPSTEEEERRKYLARRLTASYAHDADMRNVAAWLLLCPPKAPPKQEQPTKPWWRRIFGLGAF